MVECRPAPGSGRRFCGVKGRNRAATTPGGAVGVNRERMQEPTRDPYPHIVRIAKLDPRHRRHLSPLVIDAGIALAAAVLTVAGIASTDESTSDLPDLFAYSLGVAA